MCYDKRSLRLLMLMLYLLQPCHLAKFEIKCRTEKRAREHTKRKTRDDLYQAWF